MRRRKGLKQHGGIPIARLQFKEKDETCWGCGAKFENGDVSKTSKETLAAEMEEKKAPDIKTIHFEFTGKTGEYFKIWIVNIFLTILTLGIYSAWAKVRKRRYFYGNTLLLNAPFEYLADPIKILKGRFIVFGCFVIYTIMMTIVFIHLLR